MLAWLSAAWSLTRRMENPSSAAATANIAEVTVENKLYRTQMQKEIIIRRLKDKGCRITKQRLMLLDIILEEECSCCKEIYYKAVQKDAKVGTATVYRMINTLEEIGAISRKNMYKIACGEECNVENACTIELDDDTVLSFSAKKWHEIIRSGLSACGYIKEQGVRSVNAKYCECGR